MGFTLRTKINGEERKRKIPSPLAWIFLLFVFAATVGIWGYGMVSLLVKAF